MSSSASPLGANQSWFLGTGRRKESIARVFLRAGSGKFTVNGRPVEQYFPNHAWKHDAIEPLKFTNCTTRWTSRTAQGRRRRRTSRSGAHGTVARAFALESGAASFAAQQRIF